MAGPRTTDDAGAPALRRRRVARRLALAFLVSAGLPVAALALVAALHTSRVVSDLALEALLDHSRGYGQSLYERLFLAEEVLMHTGLGAPGHDPIPGDETPHPFTAVATARGSELLALGDSPRPLTGAEVAGHRRPAAGETALWAGAGEPPSLYMAYGGPDGQTLIGRVDHGYLFGDEARYPFRTTFCVIGADSRQVVHCPSAPGSLVDVALRDADPARRPPRLEVARHGELLLGTSWDLFLPGSFDHETWRVAALQPREHALRPAAAFQQVLPPVAGLAFVVAGALGLSQIRRTHPCRGCWPACGRSPGASSSTGSMPAPTTSSARWPRR